MNNALTAAILVAFILAFILVSYLSKRSPQKSYGSSSENFIIGGRGIGTIVLVLSMGATYFSTWTLLGAFGAYYRSGVWFAGFAVLAITGREMEPIGGGEFSASNRKGVQRVWVRRS